ncbi:uncharacterized protein PAC_12198 [Phialocephala subalpina]|uniref:Terpene synthase n=1 Tax=Phialocephala subalpina TaxID=576137 RepID=A0A1L7XBA3_9HELO|nr:uncharacterized protein PAC_12198 [Phialocephala subalpina]
MDLEQRKQLLNSIRGQTVLMPDMRPTYENYTQLNPNYHAMIPVVDRLLESLVSNEKKLAKLKNADFALFGSTWPPKAGFNELRIVTFLAIWLFLWDDELDEPTGQHSNSFESTQKYRKETVRFIRSTMRLPEKSLQWQDQPTGIFQFFSLYGLQNIGQQIKSGVAWSLGVKYPPTASHPIIESFRVIGEALAEAYTVEQRENFFEDMRFYISSTEMEQKWHLEGEARIPTLEDYLHSRMGTSAVRPCLAVIEFANGIRGRYAATTNEPSLTALSDEATKIVIIANDMLSLKKEIRVGVIDSLVPLLCLRFGDVQNALREAQSDLAAAVDRFELEARTLLDEPNETRLSYEELRMFIEGARDCWIGNFSWSMRTGRYMLGDIDKANGSFSVTL